MNCCFNRVMDNNEPFLQITNYTDLNIYFVLQYNTSRGCVTRQSGILKRNQSQRMYIIRTATNAAFNVINDSSPSKDLICNHALQLPGNSYFKVVETPTGVSCIQD